MSKRSFYRVMTLLLLVITTLVLAGCSGGGAPSPTPEPTRPRDTPVPFAADTATFNEFLKDAGLGYMPEGAKIPDGLVKDKTDYKKGDDLCFYVDAIKQTRVTYEIYDAKSLSLVAPRVVVLSPMVPGYNVNCDHSSQGAGSYEFRLYINEKPVKSIPFTVTE
jgi:hypothetical protein